MKILEDDMESTLASIVSFIEERKNPVYQLTQEIYFDMDKKILYKNRQELLITAKEYLFLELVIKKKGYILSREMIEEAVYQYETMSAAALKNLLFRIRKKLGKDFIQTLPELGYKVHI
ncbi:winged helix-turn-helix transcriptional regulator [Sulfurimonas sp. SAG-AH-194-C21]|nr:winged helix-turn-helix domain-containing protein [Sulfurimonas sp. SAG-AH-194-C21]MDF1883297.1 winged helix-turn-helix transcriptional regulator [Sulfurimonas sp. SAG-AH-194-C21]